MNKADMRKGMLLKGKVGAEKNISGVRFERKSACA